MSINYIIELKLPSLLILCLTGIAVFAIYVYWKKRTHTREYFAFAASSASIFFSLLVLSTLLTQQTPWAGVLDFVKQLQGLPHEATGKLTAEQIILTVLVWGGTLGLLWKLYIHWPGAKSTAQYHREQIGEAANPIEESMSLMKHWLHKESLVLYEADEVNKHSLLEGAVADLTWREQARDLVELVRKDYRFEADAWHEEAKCWIGQHQGTGEQVILVVRQNAIDAEAQFSTVQAYIKRVQKGGEQASTSLNICHSGARRSI